MKSRFILFKRAGVYYSEDTVTRKQHSLRTKDEAEALAILHSKNEAHRQPVLNLQIARTYLTATDPEVAKRTWQTAMDELTKTKTGNTHLALFSPHWLPVGKRLHGAGRHCGRHGVAKGIASRLWGGGESRKAHPRSEDGQRSD